MKFHITSDGEVKECRAKSKPCPLQNFDSKEQAEDVLLRTYGSPFDKKPVSDLSEARALYGDHVSEHSIDLPKSVENVLNDLKSIGSPLLVGGAVRDSFEGHNNKDYDIEVHNTDIDSLARFLKKSGYVVDEVGKQFGILKASKGSISDLDISVPRTENRSGAGHRDFSVHMDKNMTVEEASLRRDFTFNSVMYDHSLGVIIDPNNGHRDFDNRVMRHVSDKFSEDPLRVLRGMQFASRFGMSYAPETAELAKNLRSEFDSISVERVRGEFEKFFSKGRDFRAGIRALQDSGWDDISPGLRESLQREETLKGLDRIREVAVVDKSNVSIMVSSVIAKNMSKEDRDAFFNLSLVSQDERVRASAILDTDALSLDTPYARKKAALRLSKTGASLRDVRNFAVVTGDSRGTTLANWAIREKIADGPEPDLIQGRDVLDITDRKPGPWIGKLLSELREEQYQGRFNNKDEAIQQLHKKISEIS